MKITNLWSKRWNPARGHHWKLERECSIENSFAWLEVFQKDEPDVEFKLSEKKPRIK